MTPDWACAELDIDGETVPNDVQSVRHYWDGLRGAQNLPAWRHFDWLGIPAHIIPWCSVADILNVRPVRFGFRFWGSRRAWMYNADLTGAASDSASHRDCLDKAVQDFEAVILKQAPAFFEIRACGGDSNDLVYKTAHFPFHGGGHDVRFVLSMTVVTPEVVRSLQTLRGINADDRMRFYNRATAYPAERAIAGRDFKSNSA